jgi:GNAT superfamily N-acetyltransferase
MRNSLFIIREREREMDSHRDNASSPCGLEKGKISDAERIYQIHTSAIKQLCSSHYGEDEISKWAGKQKQETYIPFLESGSIIVAKKNGIVVGFIHHIYHPKDINTDKSPSKQCSDYDEMQIKGLFIDPSFARNGLGRILFKEVEKIAVEKDVGIMTVSASLNSLPFYQKMEFKEVERKLHQITSQCSVECVSMVKSLVN